MPIDFDLDEFIQGLGLGLPLVLPAAEFPQGFAEELTQGFVPQVPAAEFPQGFVAELSQRLPPVLTDAATGADQFARVRRLSVWYPPQLGK